MSDLSHSRIDEIDPVLDCLSEVHRKTGCGYGTVFRDWVDLMVAAFSRDEERYRAILAEYEDLGADVSMVERTYGIALGELLNATIEYQHEVLGAVYEAVGVRSDALGQHFTPHNVSDAIAAMNLPGKGRLSEARDDPVRIADPACGSGRLLISSAMQIDQAVDTVPASRPAAVYHGKDLDETCAKMTALNLVIARVPGLVVYGDTIKATTHRIWRSQPGAVPPLAEVTDDVFDPFAPPRDEEETGAEGVGESGEAGDGMDEGSGAPDQITLGGVDA